MVAQRHGDAHGNAACDVALEGSDESLNLSRTPPKKGIRMRSDSGGRFSRATAGVKRDKPLGTQRAGRGRASSAGAALSVVVAPAKKRPPQELPEHTTYAAAADTVEAHLAALVAYQNADHEYFVKIREVVRVLEQNEQRIESEAHGCKDASILLRRDIFAVRDSLTSEFKDRLNSDLGRAVRAMQTELAQQTENTLASFGSQRVSSASELFSILGVHAQNCVLHRIIQQNPPAGGLGGGKRIPRHHL